ncbi:ABC transporter substrate-binding protein [Plantactinospora sp. GCM10030261]|uniref:ABC transporter substrate-binding protein n=1 Tax=Plantactinospora sp. GCM10030261 TaxID=3273420 RepID=UPI0036122588
MRVRKGLAAMAGLLASALAVTGCGGSGGSDGATTSVSMWVYPVISDEAQHRAFWDDKVAAFKAENSGIDVKVEIFPWANRDQSLSTALAGNKGPDVVYLIPDQLPKYARNIEPVDTYLDAAAKDDYLDNVKESVTIDGKMMGAPILTSAQGLLCNKKVFAAVGQTTYPKTWDELLAMAPAFKAKGFDMTAYPGDPKQTLNLTFYPLLWQAGGDVFGSDGTSAAFNSDAGRKALTFLKQLVDGGYVDKSLITALPPIEQTRIGQGKVGCVWHLEPAAVEPVWGKDNIQALAPLTGTKQAQYGTVGSLVMLRGAEDKAAAGKWISFATAPENAKEYDLAARFFSPKKSVGTLYPADPVLGELEKNVGLTTVGPLNEKSRDIMGALAPEIQAALLGRKPVDRALGDAEKAANALLG